MSSVPAASSSSSTTGSGQSTAGAVNKALGKQDFLSLLIAQLRNQDPLQPMEDKEFIAQMAQFNTLEQLQQLNQTMTATALGTSLSQAGALLGKQVDAVGAKGAIIHGVVSAVTVENGQAVVEVGKDKVPLTAISRMTDPPVTPTPVAAAAGTGTTTGGTTT